MPGFDDHRPAFEAPTEHPATYTRGHGIKCDQKMESFADFRPGIDQDTGDYRTRMFGDWKKAALGSPAPDAAPKKKKNAARRMEQILKIHTEKDSKQEQVS